MAHYSTAELDKLVKDGIKTIEFIQQNKKNNKETYGRSAIQKPSTRERVKAWENHPSLQDHSYEGRDPDNGGIKRDEEAGGSRDTGFNTGDGNEVKIEEMEIDTRGETSNNYTWNATDTPSTDGDDRRDPEGGFCAANKGRDSEPAGAAKSQRSIGDDKVSLEEYRQILMADHESAMLEEAGAASPGTTMREATTDDFAMIFNEGTPRVHRRLKGVAEYTHEEAPRPRPVNPVKKGTDGNTVSTPLVDVQSSESGATLGVHESLLRQPNTNAYAESAQSGVSDVSTTRCTDESGEAAQGHKEVEGKIDLLLSAVDRITRKLDSLPEIKEEIKNINKKITNLSLGLSTIEGYIKSMMIIIPGSGNKNEGGTTDINPDLKPVLGRDNTRGLPELFKKRNTLESLDQEISSTQEISEEHVIQPLDFTKANASNFIPGQDLASYKTIVAMIHEEVKDIESRIALLQWVDSTREEMPMSDIYTAVRESLDAIANQH
ncbi:phosphoprotein [Wufeng Eothenomys melanogaster jeilongvirus 1]|uniref:Phosphoprotein n=1 Tax=Wufeng Eothenomys melanogaster jeilongvirus 1 TaxID=2928990 RepID=A0A8T9KQ62_9MONO|nr:phosphoprotein [Wufeng Eothenomys melanogaster jeilongvirus 1]WPV62626.1 MAG: phosphoprotein [Wufeng rodent jeilongvirus 2]